MSSNKAPRLVAFPLLLLLAACDPGEYFEPADLTQQDSRLSHPVGVELRSLHATVARLDAAGGFTVAQQEQLRRIAGEAQRRAAGATTVSGGEPAWTHRVAEQLRRLGVAEVAEENSGERGTAAIDLAVWEARLPDCGKFERGLNPDYDNAPNDNWGCSIQRNIAAMVQNPADLARARANSGRDANRAADVLDKYGRGAATGSAPEVADNGTDLPLNSQVPQ